MVSLNSCILSLIMQTMFLHLCWEEIHYYKLWLSILKLHYKIKFNLLVLTTSEKKHYLLDKCKKEQKQSNLLHAYKQSLLGNSWNIYIKKVREDENGSMVKELQVCFN